MATWYKITLAYKDCGIGGKGQRLQEAFLVVFVANGGKPWTAALFSQRSEDFKEVFYYFSPDASQIASTLMESYRAVPCERPPYPTMESHINLAVGEALAFELLWPKEHRNS